MSYAQTYPKRPARMNQQHPSQQPHQQDQLNNNNNPAEPRKLEHQGAYAVLKPDQKKREKILRTADAESKAYDKYKQGQRVPQYHTTTATVGGGGSTRSQGYSTRSTVAQPHPPAPRRSTGAGHTGAMSRPQNLKPIVKKPSLKSQSVRIDDAEVERHKAAQRQKAQTLAQKQQIRHESLDQDRLRKNNDFLDRLEGKR